MDGKQADIFEVLSDMARWVQEGKYGTGDDLDAEWLQQDLEGMAEDIASILEV